MIVAVDAMGGDHAPGEIVKGTLEAAPLISGGIILVGDLARLEPLLPSTLPKNLTLRHASEEIGMDESPTEAFRRKKDASLVVAANIVRDGEATSMVSAGNTGAATAVSLLTWRQMAGVHRPAIASQFPNANGGFLLLDAGASPDVDPEHLVEFAMMGRAYAQKALDRKEPTVHLLNIGEEEGKGNQFAKQAYKLLSRFPWFSGNIEGKDMFLGRCDVVVCDAFVGNITLKTSEGVAEYILGTIKAQVPENPIGKAFFLPLKRILAPLRKQMDYAEYGGSPLLGLNGLTMICHGRSNAKAIRNAIIKAHHATDNRILETIRDSIGQLEPVTP
ncbi:MAG: phosphate acyltransferase PlsX [Nitrospirae bacterium]|nr:phosphate acyltransferase PlsX [Fimbriimonadaceae bacterium]